MQNTDDAKREAWVKVASTGRADLHGKIVQNTDDAKREAWVKAASTRRAVRAIPTGADEVGFRRAVATASEIYGIPNVNSNEARLVYWTNNPAHVCFCFRVWGSGFRV